MKTFNKKNTKRLSNIKLSMFENIKQKPSKIDETNGLIKKV
jgi:hypothetical protein